MIEPNGTPVDVLGADGAQTGKVGAYPRGGGQKGQPTKVLPSAPAGFREFGQQCDPQTGQPTKLMKQAQESGSAASHVGTFAGMVNKGAAEQKGHFALPGDLAAGTGHRDGKGGNSYPDPGVFGTPGGFPLGIPD